MNLRRFINKNQELIKKVIIIIVFVFIGIKLLNFAYEKDEENKRIQLSQNDINAEKNEEINITENTIESNSIDITMSSFVNFCNEKKIEEAYKMLTQECKKAMFPTVDDFEKIYINNVYNIKREYELTKWSAEGNITTCLVTLYGDLLATGGTANSKQEFYTFVEEESGNYKLNINNYIYGEDRKSEITTRNITVKINHVDIYEEYEEAKITIKNNTGKTICLTGNKYNKNIYLQNSSGISYSSLSSKFDKENIVMKPNSIQSFTVKFNKLYSATNKATKLVLSDVILDYESYLNSEDKNNYSNRTSINVQYQY